MSSKTERDARNFDDVARRPVVRPFSEVCGEEEPFVVDPLLFSNIDREARNVGLEPWEAFRSGVATCGSVAISVPTGGSWFG